MKTTRWMMCLAAAALVLGCEQTTEPVAEADAVDLPAFKAEHVTLVREFVWDGAEGTSFVACANDGAGEDLYYDGIVVATTKKVYTPSGMYLRSTKIDDFIGLHHAQFQATGLTSGDVWIVNPKGRALGPPEAPLTGTVSSIAEAPDLQLQVHQPVR